jgi:hypothetical protein
MGSRFDDWTNCRVFTITINYDISQSMTVYHSLHSLLGRERLLFHLDERQTTAHILNSLNSSESVESELLYDWRFTANQFDLATSPLRLTARISFLKWTPVVIVLILYELRMGPTFTIAAGPRQRIHSRVRVPWDSRPYFTVSDSRFLFLSPLRLAGKRCRYSTPPPIGKDSFLITTLL